MLVGLTAVCTRCERMKVFPHHTQGALAGLIGRRAIVGGVIAMSLWAGIFIGWGTYDSVGRAPNEKNVYVCLCHVVAMIAPRCSPRTRPTGCFDWILGRDEDGFDFTGWGTVHGVHTMSSLAAWHT